MEQSSKSLSRFGGHSLSAKRLKCRRSICCVISRQRDKWLSKAEADRLLEAEIDEHARLFIMLALYSGVRFGVILSLTWQQVDLVSGVINFGRGTGNKGRAIVPMVPDLHAAMRIAVGIRTTDSVIEYRDKYVKSIKTGFHMSVTRAGLGHVTPHSLRHTCATWLMMKGMPFEMVAKFLGNSVEMIERVYGHHSPDWLRRAAEALSGLSDSPEFSVPTGPESLSARFRKT
ncbi:site-specific integrase [Neoasaia chiangmaiensis]|nr:site-specific integrase [Neoasaia chiangmaiensis]